MKKLIMVLLIVMLGASLSGSAFAGWTDDFESYTSGLVLPSPWVNGNIHVLNGYTGQGAARYGYGEWTRYNEYRLAGEAPATLTAKLYTAADGGYGTLDYGKAGVGLTSGAIASTGGLWGNYYYTIMELAAGGDTGKDNNTLYFDVSDPGQDANYHRASVSGLAWNQWYDVKIVVSGSTSTGYYRATGAADWTLVGSFTQSSGFAGYNNVGIDSMRLGTIDDVSLNAVPEPSSLLAFGSSLVGLLGLALRRRR